MELRERCELARGKMDELRVQHETMGTTSKLQEDVEWLKMEIQMVQAEALTRLAYKSW